MKKKYKFVRRKPNCKIEVAVDTEVMKEIFEYVGQDQRHKDKFLDIVAVVKEGLSNRYLYKREKLDNDTKDITAMRFFVGQENDRIYCKEISRIDPITREPVKVVVMAALHLHKTSETLSDIEKGIIKKIATHEYEFEPK